LGVKNTDENPMKQQESEPTTVDIEGIDRALRELLHRFNVETVISMIQGNKLWEKRIPKKVITKYNKEILYQRIVKLLYDRKEVIDQEINTIKQLMLNQNDAVPFEVTITVEDESNPSHSAQFSVKQSVYGVAVDLLDKEKQVIVSSLIDYFDNKLYVKCWDERANSLGSDPTTSVTLIDDVEAAVNTSRDSRYKAATAPCNLSIIRLISITLLIVQSLLIISTQTTDL
jgi:hypothetical protein